ncbi:MAG: TPM domain-containing protein [Bacteroidales bacterium]|nr:TPM domain-containing protein [Bacteroidales bacterium]
MANKFRHILLAVLLLVAGIVCAQVPQRPEPPRLVNDLAGIFSDEQAARLEYRTAIFADTTSNQIAIVTVPELYGYDKAQLAYSIGEEWGVGQDKFDNGIVILIKPKTGSSSGEVFIATGYGLEGAVTDAFARRVIERAMIPYFKDNDYYGGVQAALDVMMPVISGEISTDEFSGGEDDGALAAAVFMLFFIGFVVMLILVSGNKNNRNMGGGNHRGGNGFSAADAFILGSILGNATGSRGRSSGSFGGGWSGGGGGFGGFGGGSFGGGGAGGSW